MCWKRWKVWLKSGNLWRFVLIMTLIAAQIIGALKGSVSGFVCFELNCSH